jgi:nitroimidazol reductase NimA-like FMN-containing flavoprotein (pyridoxamine 5'-phosphate oxidase superfamily)
VTGGLWQAAAMTAAQDPPWSVMEAERMTEGPTSEPDESRPELLTALDEAACFRMLAAVDVGRLAIVVQGHPRIVVLNYLLDGRALVFRTREDALIARLTADGVALHAEFEVDSALAAAYSGWSVIAAGLLVREQDPARQEAARSGIRAWAEGERDTVLRLDVAEVNGRRAGGL